jgi:hypothetical protein
MVLPSSADGPARSGAKFALTVAGAGRGFAPLPIVPEGAMKVGGRDVQYASALSL